MCSAPDTPAPPPPPPPAPPPPQKTAKKFKRRTDPRANTDSSNERRGVDSLRVSMNVPGNGGKGVQVPKG